MPSLSKDHFNYGIEFLNLQIKMATTFLLLFLFWVTGLTLFLSRLLYLSAIFIVLAMGCLFIGLPFLYHKEKNLKEKYVGKRTLQAA